MHEPTHPEVPTGKDPLGRVELLKNNPEMKEELSWRERAHKGLYESVAKFIGTGDPGANTPGMDTSTLKTQFDDVTTKTSLLDLASEASTKLLYSDDHFADQKRWIDFTQNVLQTKGPLGVKATAIAVSFLALTLPDHSDNNKLDRGRLLLGSVVQDARTVNNLGGIDTIRYRELDRTDLDTLRKSVMEGTAVGKFTSYLNYQHEAVLMKYWISWPDVFMWRAVDKTIQTFPTETVFSDSTSLLNLIAHMSPMSPEVEPPDTLKRVLDIAVEAMAKQMDITLQNNGVPTGEAYKSALSAVFEELGNSWPLTTSEKENYPKLKGKYPQRRTASQLVIVAGAKTADKYGVKSGVQ